jgi:hypothetical protein
MDPRVLRILHQLESNSFRDVAGGQVSGTLPLSERLLNELVAASLPPNGRVKEATIRPQPGNRFSVRVKLAGAAFLPAVTMTMAIERQPELPSSPQLVLRMSGLPGLMSFAGAAFNINEMMPPGVQVDGDRVVVDLAAMLARYGLREWLRYARRLQVTTDEGRLTVDFEVRV